MRFSVAWLVDVLALSKNEGIRKSTPAAGNVDRSTSSKVERWEIVEPAVGVPCPACNRAVDDCGPEEAKYQAGDDATTLERATDHNLYSASAVIVVSFFSSYKKQRLQSTYQKSN